MNWRYLDSQPLLKSLVVASVALVLATFVISSLTAMISEPSDLGVIFKVSFMMSLVVAGFFEFNLFWEAKATAKGEKWLSGFISSGLLIILLLGQTQAITRFLIEPLAVVDLRNMDPALRWVAGAGLLIVALGVYDEVLWLADKLMKLADKLMKDRNHGVRT